MFRIKIPKSIILILIFSIILNLLRVIIWGKLSFIYILWNIFLAILPFIVSSVLLNLNNYKKIKKSVMFLFLFVWLLLIPNAPYIITDLIHIGEVRAVPVLFDSFLLFSSALVGLMFGFYSTYQIESALQFYYSRITSQRIIFIFVFIMSFGIYLGRFLRFNSWDIFTKPHLIYIGIIEIITNYSNFIEASLYTLLFSIFIIISYLSFKLIKKND